jgi:hypothetical protein
MHVGNARGHAVSARRIRTLGLLLLPPLLAAAPGFAQQPEPPSTQQPAPSSTEQSSQPANQQPAQPAAPEQPPAPIAPPPGGEAQPAAQPAAPPPDTRPLAGAELVAPTLPGSGRSYILPSFSVWEGADSNSQLTTGTEKFQAATVPVGSVTLNRQGRTNQFGLRYGAGALIYDTHFGNNASFQELGLQDTYTTRRWVIFIADQGSYLPQPITGFAGFGFAGAFTGAQSLGLSQGVGQLSPGFAPQQGAISGQSGVTTDTGIAQVQYRYTPRTSFTAVGALGYDHFSRQGLYSSNNRTLSLSVDHLLNATDSVSFSYSFAAFRFSGGSVALNTHLWRLGYAHRISERFTFSVLGGPQLTYSALQGVPGVLRNFTWEGEGIVGYRRSRGGIDVTYVHYLRPGSGIFQGAETDSVRGSGNYEISRNWTASLAVNYSRSTPLADYSINPNFNNPGRIGYETGSFRITHPVSRTVKWFALYELERQESAQPFLPNGSGRVLLRHVFGFGLEFHPRPIGL